MKMKLEKAKLSFTIFCLLLVLAMLWILKYLETGAI